MYYLRLLGKLPKRQENLCLKCSFQVLCEVEENWTDQAHPPKWDVFIIIFMIYLILIYFLHSFVKKIVLQFSLHQIMQGLSISDILKINSKVFQLFKTITLLQPWLCLNIKYIDHTRMYTPINDYTTQKQHIYIKQ